MAGPRLPRRGRRLWGLALLMAAVGLACAQGQGAVPTAQETSSQAPTAPVSGDAGDDAAVSQYSRLTPRGPREFDPRAFSQLIGPDVIEPIYEPVVVPAHEATLKPQELVMGVEINGEARAYPVGILRFREMVNDTLGGVPILVTW